MTLRTGPVRGGLASALAVLALSCSGGATSGDYVPEEFVPAATLAPLHVDGNRIAGAGGETVVLRGLALADPDQLERDGHWDAEYFDQARSWGAEVVRIPVHPKFWRNRGPAAYLALLDRGVSWAEERGMYVILDWHGMGDPNAEVYDLSYDGLYATSQAETRTFWRIAAAHYRRDPGVAFFELFNENTNWTGSVWTATSWAQWKVLAEALVDVVRGQGAAAICVVGGFRWAYDLSPVGADPIDRDGVAYSVHPYPSKGSPASWEADFGYLTATHPVFATEFGFDADPGDGVAYGTVDGYGRPITDYFASHGIGWTAWVFHPTWTPSLLAGWDYAPAAPQGAFFRGLLQGR